MALSKKDQGYIRANEGVPYPLEQLSGMLMSQFDTFEKTLGLVTRVIEKCLSPAIGKLKKMKDGTLFVLSHESYLLSDRWERELNKRKAIPNKRKRIPSKRKSSNILLSNIISSNIILSSIKEWNDFAKKWNLRPILDIEPGSTRETHLRARMKKKGFSLEVLLQKIEKQPFLLGQNDKAWTITFDWILCPSNYTKIMEEQYPARTPRNEVTRDRQVGANKRPVSIEERQAQEEAKKEYQTEGKK